MNTPREGRPGAHALRAALFVLSVVSTSVAAGEAAGVATIAPRAIAWAQAQSESVARSGAPLTPAQIALARSVGVRHPELIRVAAVDHFPLPQEAEVKAAAMRIGLAKPSIVGLTLGHSVLVRRGFENDPRLLSHEFRHVHQYEAHGGIAGFLAQHLQDLAKFGYDDSPFEVDARAHEVGGHL